MKKRIFLTKVLVLVLALSMMVSMFAACANDDDKENATGSSTTAASGDTGNSDKPGSSDDSGSSNAPGSSNEPGSSNAPVGSDEPGSSDEPASSDTPASSDKPADSEEERETDINGFIVDGIPEDLKFDTGVKILCDPNYKKQVFVKEEEVGDDPINAIIHKRGITVEERLGIEIEWIPASKGAWGGAQQVLQEVEIACETDPYDAISAYNLTPYLLAFNGLCANLYGTEYMDLTAPWWPASLLDEILVNDTLYVVSESNDYGLLRNMMAMFFNAELLEARDLESPYDLVENNEWTIDKLSEMIKDTYSDENGDSTRDVEDMYGFVNATEAKRDSWYFALGYKYAEVQNDEIVSLLSGEHIQTYIDKMLNFYTEDTMLWDTAKYGGQAQDIMFRNERAYFYSTGVFVTEEIKYHELDFEYGVVPMPKLNSEQERYYTHLSNTYDAWCVSFNAADLDLSSALLECMASEAYRQIGPTYFDTYVKLRYASNEDLGPMYDLVRDSVTFDLIYLYSFAFSPNPKDSAKSCITNPEKNSWSSIYASNKDMWSTAFDQIVATYAK